MVAVGITRQQTFMHPGGRNPAEEQQRQQR